MEDYESTPATSPESNQKPGDQDGDLQLMILGILNVASLLTVTALNYITYYYTKNNDSDTLIRKYRLQAKTSQQGGQQSKLSTGGKASLGHAKGSTLGKSQSQQDQKSNSSGKRQALESQAARKSSTGIGSAVTTKPIHNSPSNAKEDNDSTIDQATAAPQATSTVVVTANQQPHHERESSSGKRGLSKKANS